MTRIILSGTIVTVASLALGGCFYFPSERSTSRSTRSSTPTSPATSPSGGAYTTEVGRGELLQGDLGSVPRFSSTEPELQVRRSGTTYATVRLDHVDGAARVWAMTTLTIRGGLDHPSLRPGAHLTFTSTSPTSGANALSVSVLGCSGPMRDRYTYDRTATGVTVDVMPGDEPGTNRMVFTADFPNGTSTQRVQGSFEYDPQ